MEYLHFPHDLARKAIRLTSEQIANPQIVITEFFKFYDLNSIRIELVNWLEFAYGSNDPDMTKPITRVNLMQFSYQLEAFLEAAFLLHHNPGNIDKL
jgi:hypothetical protein